MTHKQKLTPSSSYWLDADEMHRDKEFIDLEPIDPIPPNSYYRKEEIEINLRNRFSSDHLGSKILVTSYTTAYDITSLIRNQIGIITKSITLYWKNIKLFPKTNLFNMGMKSGDTIFVETDDILKQKLDAYLSHDDENAITEDQFLALSPEKLDAWFRNALHTDDHTHPDTIQEGWKLMKQQRSLRAEPNLPEYWIIIFCDIVLYTGFKFLSFPTFKLILNDLLQYHGYRKDRLQDTKECILKVMNDYESKQYRLGKTFLTFDDNIVVNIEEGLTPKFTDGKKIYEASSLIGPIELESINVLRIVSSFSKPIADKILRFVSNKDRLQPFGFFRKLSSTKRSKSIEWFQFVDPKKGLCAIGHIPLFGSEYTGFINPYQEKSVKQDDQFWPHLHLLSIGSILLSVLGQIYDNRSEGIVWLYYANYAISGLASNGILHEITKIYSNKEKVKGSLRHKLLDGLISMHHHPDNFREFTIKPILTTMLYKEGIPLINNKVTIVYENNEKEEGFFSSKLSSSRPHRRVLIQGIRRSQNLICDGKYDFKTGALQEGQAKYDFQKFFLADPMIEPSSEKLISLKEISKGLYPHEDVYKGRWNSKGILSEGTIFHKDGSIEFVRQGKIVTITPSESRVIVAPPEFNRMLFQSEKHRKALQQVNKKRVSALHLGQPKISYKTALFAKYRGAVKRTPASDSLRASLQALFQQSQANKPLRKQFMRRLFQDEASQKQLLEILLRVLKLYEQNRKTIVTGIRDTLRFDMKTLRRNGNVSPIVRKALFDALVTFPEMKEMDDIYVPFEGKETLQELIYDMAPKELILGDDLVKKIKETGIQEKLFLLIDDFISTLVGNIATHLPMEVLQKIQGGQAAPAVADEEEEEEDAMIYFSQEQAPAQRARQVPIPVEIEAELCSWNISWLDLRVHEERLKKSIELLALMNFSTDFILLQETPFDRGEFQYFNELLEEAELGNLKLDVFHRAVVQPYLKVAGMTEQLHGMMIMANRSKWDIVQRKRPKSYLLLPRVSKEASDVPEGGGIVSSMPARLFYSEGEIMKEQDLNRRAEWYSADGMKDEHHEPHLFTKLSTLSGLFQSKTHPSFYMIVMNIHVRKTGYNARYRTRLLKGINEQIRLYIGYVETIEGSSFGIVIGGDFNRSDQYIILEILNGIPALQNGHVIMNPIPIKKPSIDAFLIPEHARATPEYIQYIWQQRQRQLGDRLFPEGGHTPFKIMLTFPI